MNIFKHLANTAAVLLTAKEPYPQPYKAPEIIAETKRGVLVKANSGSEALRITTEGTTPAHPSGQSASWVARHHGDGVYEVRAETWDELTPEGVKPFWKMTDEERQEWYDNQRGCPSENNHVR